MKDKIKIAIIGIGNCASSLIQGIHYHGDSGRENLLGLMHFDICGYKPGDIEIVAAFDVDSRKVGLDVSQAIFAEPNCTKKFSEDIQPFCVKVSMGNVKDGIASHMRSGRNEEVFCLSDESEPSSNEVVKILKDSGTEILLNYLPVGSEAATHFYVECALSAGVAFINNIPVFIASNPKYAAIFKEKNIPLIGDDIKSQIGATIVHRVLTDLFKKRGVHLKRTYQLNTGGNTDFRNMLDRNRLKSKKISKTEAVQAVTANRLADENIHIGPSDYVPWQKDNKVCFIRMEGDIFGGVPMNLDLRLSVEDSPNSAGVVIDSIRCAKIAIDRNYGGVLLGPSAYFCKHPPQQYTDDIAFEMVEDFIS